MEGVLVPVPVLDSEVLTAGVRDPSPRPASRGVKKAKQNPALEKRRHLDSAHFYDLNFSK